MRAPAERPNLLDFDLPGLTARLAGWGYSGFHAMMVWSYLYRHHATAVAAMSELRPDLRARLQAETVLRWPELVLAQRSGDGTRKFLLRLDDGEVVEAVLMPYRDRYTACISTQVGCAMGCVFCATGQMGFTRHLSAGEITGQILFLQQAAGDEARELRNIVFMGMGEPLHNYEATMRAVDILTDDRGLAFGPRHLTLSTVGLPAAIRRLADEERPVNLAVSLHGATDAARQALVPVARHWSLAELLEACRYYVDKRGRHIFFEWTLIAGENDTAEQAHALGELLQELDGHVNLIPLNPTGEYEGTPSQREAIRQFKAILDGYGLPSTVRQRRGIDIDAGCGQLRKRAGLAPAP
ncbi:MAG: 23S rRNA (adenine(2503)-C(2))-methyltransferase RlmN [Anaerolineae bacterium]|nr:23S rRNA (adenine(2503)-C(2))-methyltransferase RlmN [Anaerolineae bacterium]